MKKELKQDNGNCWLCVLSIIKCSCSCVWYMVVWVLFACLISGINIAKLINHICIRIKGRLMICSVVGFKFRKQFDSTLLMPSIAYTLIL